MLQDIRGLMKDDHIFKKNEDLINAFRKVLNSDIKFTMPGTGKESKLSDIEFNFSTALQTLYAFNRVLARDIIIKDEINNIEKIYNLIINEIVRLGKQYHNIVPGIHYSALVCFFINYQTISFVNESTAFDTLLKIIQNSEQVAVDKIFFKVRN